MIEFVDKPIAKPLNEYPGRFATPAQRRVVDAVIDLVRRAGFFTGGLRLNLKTVAGPDHLRGVTRIDPTGEFDVYVNVAVAPIILAEAVAHECAHVQHFIDNPDFRYSRIVDPEKIRAMYDESERVAHDFAQRVHRDACIDAMVRAAEREAAALEATRCP